jgi:hypothetical protein
MITPKSINKLAVLGQKNRIDICLLKIRTLFQLFILFAKQLQQLLTLSVTFAGKYFFKNV